MTDPLTIQPAPDALNNGESVYRKGEFFRKQLNFDNGSNPFWEQVTVSATGETSIQGSHSLEQTPEHFAYDDDGNLSSDGRWNYTWDAENRLVSMDPSTTTGPREAITMEYDWKGRRVKKRTVVDLPAPSTDLTIEIKFLYDGWNPIAELNSDNSVLRTYIWGLDLSGSPQGAGGVGGLLEVVYHGSETTNYFVAFDGNGNVAALVNASDGGTSAAYEYGPFGELLRATGPMAKANPLRFSTKYHDDETDLLYYGYRCYNAESGRWISRDPIGERGGCNLSVFTSNDPANAIDRLGKQCCLITVSRGPNSVMGHSILACDNGTYISKSTEGELNPQWRSPAEDYSQDPDIGFPGSTFTTNCIPCADEDKVTRWFVSHQNDQWTYSDNCATAALDAIEAGLPQPQAKPVCCHANQYARNLLRELSNGITPAFPTPTYVHDRVDDFNSRNTNCNKWKCTDHTNNGHS
jgi:RHS repeat-associated protein